jgi:homoserine kinase
MALQIHSRYEVRPLASADLIIEASGLNADDIPTDASNLCYRAFCSLFDRASEPTPSVYVRIRNGIPLERGLGGSASAILGGLLSANAWLGDPFSQEELLLMATELDGHPDNVAASLYGGLRVACWDGRRVLSLPLGCSDALQIVLAVPRVRVATAAARRVLPQVTPFDDAVFNVGRVALLVAAFAAHEFGFLASAMEDRLHQPYRRRLEPQMDEVFEAARAAGALSVALSGAGPTIAAYCVGRAEDVGEAMRKCFARAGIDATIHLTTIDFQGACASWDEEAV